MQYSPSHSRSSATVIRNTGDDKKKHNKRNYNSRAVIISQYIQSAGLVVGLVITHSWSWQFHNSRNLCSAFSCIQWAYLKLFMRMVQKILNSRETEQIYCGINIAARRACVTKKLLVHQVALNLKTRGKVPIRSTLLEQGSRRVIAPCEAFMYFTAARGCRQTSWKVHTAAVPRNAYNNQSRNWISLRNA